MITQISYNVIIDRFKAFASGHYLIERFTHGELDVTDIEKENGYPWMHVFPVSIEPRGGSRLYSFAVIFADLPREKETPTEYQRESLSDCIRLAEDLLAEIQNGLVVFGPTVELDGSPSIEPLIQEFTHTLTGVKLELTISVPWDWSACDIPADWSVGGTGSGGSGVGVGLVLRVNNTDNVSQDILDLINGTNVTITDLGNGQVRIDATGGISSINWGDIGGTLANQTDLATALGLKANSADLGAVAFSNDYNDLDNLPTIPTLTSDLTNDSGFITIGDVPTQVQSNWTQSDNGQLDFIKNKPTLATVATSGSYTDLINKPSIPAAQVNSDWNASSGLAQILNKPSLATVATSGSYTDLTNKPTIPAAQVNSDWNASSGLAQILNKPIIPAAQIQSDWNQSNNASLDFIKNKPSLGAGTVTSVALTMPAAFTVGGSPITTAGTLGVTGAGVASQYIRGDGTLANFPTGGGGGASVNYYLNGSVSQGTIGGATFQQLGKTAVVGTGTDFVRTNGAGNGYIAQFITDINDPALLLIPSGNWHFETFFSASSSGGSPSFYIELYKYNGATLTLIASNAANPEGITAGTTIDLYTSVISVPATVLTATDRIAIRIFVTTSGRTLTLHTEGSHLSEITTTFSTGITAINSLTAQVQSLTTGTAGTDFAINSAGSVHTFNLPTANAANRGALSSADWTTFNGKQDAIGLTTVGTNLATLPNPSAIRYLRVNADNSVSALTLAQLKTDLSISSNITVILGSNVTNVGTALEDITAFSFAVSANKTYRFRTTILYARTSGTGYFSVNGPTFATNGMSYRFTQPGTATTNQFNNQIAYNGGTSATLASGGIVIGEGIIKTTASGTVIMRMQCSAGASLTIQAGSFIEYSEIA